MPRLSGPSCRRGHSSAIISTGRGLLRAAHAEAKYSVPDDKLGCRRT